MTEKEDFYNKFALEYLQRHPDVPLPYARRQARLRWRSKLIARNSRKEV